jgi:hypothetical protein
LFAAYTYLAVCKRSGFAHVGYPQLRPAGIAKIVSTHRWCRAGRAERVGGRRIYTAWIAASIAHYLANQKAEAFMPVILLVRSRYRM